MKIAAIILQSLLFALTFVAFVRLPKGSYHYPVAALLLWVTAVTTIVVLLRPLGRGAQIAVIVLNALWILLVVALLVSLLYHQLAHGGQKLLPGVLTALIAVPYIVSIMAISKQRFAKLDTTSG